jgi:carbon-monoxide dehydrogenase large subunit
VYGASRRLREKLLNVAAGILEVSPDEVELVDGIFRPTGVPGRSLTLRDVARATAPGLKSRSPSEGGAGLQAEHYFLGPVVTYGSSTHAVVVEVDEETGHVTLLRYVIVHECGRELNPMVVAGQMQGGVAHGLGGALFEEAVYDEQGQFLTSSFMDYLLPGATEIPPIQVSHQECSLTDRNPLGVKGCGEGGTTSAPAAVANAIADALAPLTVDPSELPLSPDRVWRQIAQAKRQQAAVRTAV